MKITITEQAQVKIDVFAQKEAKEDECFRIYVQGGGCSGFEYGFRFDMPSAEDYCIELNDLKVIVDPFSATYMDQAVIDYYEDFRGAGFQVQNPNAKTTCGCGMSFAV